MTSNRFAVIDLGSNTFHLLIAEIQEDGSWKEIHKEREYVKLASGGIRHIDANAEQRALDAMIRFKNLVIQHNVLRTRAIGTAAMREAVNANEIAKKLAATTGFEVEIIDGEREAQYIREGIRAALPQMDHYSLIMDIGGGSVEYILYKGGVEYFKRSFKIGVALLYDTFHHSDPISGEEIHQVKNYINHEVSELYDALKKIGSYYLVGASGSFEVLLDTLPKLQEGPHWAELDISQIDDILAEVIKASLEERRQMAFIPVERLDYIVVAYLLIKVLIDQARPEKLFYCEYALKEGVMQEMTYNFRLN